MIEYLLLLDELDGKTSLFGWRDPSQDGTGIALTISRRQWEKMGRPNRLKITVTP